MKNASLYFAWEYLNWLLKLRSFMTTLLQVKNEYLAVTARYNHSKYASWPYVLNRDIGTRWKDMILTVKNTSGTSICTTIRETRHLLIDLTYLYLSHSLSSLGCFCQRKYGTMWCHNTCFFNFIFCKERSNGQIVRNLACRYRLIVKTSDASLEIFTGIGEI